MRLPIIRWNQDYWLTKRFLRTRSRSSPIPGSDIVIFFRDGIIEVGFIDDTYHYLPLGIDLGKEFKDGWKIRANLEYDQLLRGYYSAPFSDWNIGSSDITSCESDGAPIIHQETKATIVEIGLSLGIRF